MELQEVIKELQNIKNYCTPNALPALEQAISILTEMQENQEKGET